MTRVLSLLGCDLPKTVLAASEANEAGHWESENIGHLNDRILGSAGSYWDDWLEFNPGWLQSPKAEVFRGDALGLVQEEFGSSRLFVLKDPRICRLLAFWLDVLEQAGARPLIVSPVRNPLEVAAALERRNGREAGLGHLLWLRHVLDAEYASRGTPRLFTSYDRLLSGWARIAADAQSTFGIAWPRMSDQVAAEIEAFLSDEYRHDQQAVETALETPALSNWLRNAFQILGNWAAAGEQSKDFAALDRIRAQFNAAAPAFSRLIAAGQKAAGKITHVEQALAATQSKLSTAEEATAAEQERAKCLMADVESQTGAAEAAEQALAESQAKLGRAEQATAAEQERAARLESELGTARQRLGESEQQISRLKSDLESQTGAAEAAEQALAETQARLGRAEQATAAEQEKAARLETDLGIARQRLGEQEQQIWRLRSDLESHAGAAKEAEDSLAEIRDRLAQTESALVQRRHEAEQTAGELAAARDELRQSAAARDGAEKVSAGLKEHVVLLMADLKERQEAFAALQKAQATELAKKDEAFSTVARQVKEVMATLDTARHELAAKLDAQVRETAQLHRRAEEQAAAAEQERARQSAELQKARAEADMAKAESRQLETQLKARIDQVAAGQAELDRMRQMSARQLGLAIAKLLNEHGGRVPWGRLRLRRQASLLKRSGLFDAAWYLRHYTDVAESGLDPLRHYIEYGAKEGRAPNAALAHANGQAEPEPGSETVPRRDAAQQDAGRKPDSEAAAIADAKAAKSYTKS